ncbi:hypothetical protein Pfo_027490, partial [Paulownia fortunei]
KKQGLKQSARQLNEVLPFSSKLLRMMNSTLLLIFCQNVHNMIIDEKTYSTVTVSTPFSMAAFTSSNFAFSGSLNRRRNLPLLLSTRCHLSVVSSCSFILSPLIWRILPSSTSTFTSSSKPGTSALKTWASGVSFQSMRALENDEASRAGPGTLDPRCPVKMDRKCCFDDCQRSSESETFLFSDNDV